jgi:nesprin-1
MGILVDLKQLISFILQVHQNLLTSQQSVLLSKSDDPDGKLGRGLVELSVAEQFNSLTNLHNETLARIMERHGEVRERLTSWDRYRHDQARLLCWLRDTERERGRLQLRYIHTRRIPKMLQRIEVSSHRITSTLRGKYE